MSFPRSYLVIRVAALAAVWLLCSGHDMFLKLDRYYLPPASRATIELVNGTFAASENVIDRNRMLDVSLVGNGQRTAVDTAQWFDFNLATILDFTTGKAGTWVAGVSTRARTIEMEAQAFNDYLAHDGVVDMLNFRKENNLENEDANELYSKHVKTIFQVGDTRSEDYATPLGYPIEFVPLANPYAKATGDQLRVRLLLRGEALVNQLVLLGIDDGSQTHDHDHHHDHNHDTDGHHQHESEARFRTDANGELTLDLDRNGVYYLRTIHMVEREDEGLTHESNWATLTFRIGPDQAPAAQAGHSHDHDHDHDHHHHDEGGIPAYAYWLISFLIVGGLFVYFNRQEA